MLVKRLTHSDLSYFELYHRRTGMRQKAINLDQQKMRNLFPALQFDANTARYPVTVNAFSWNSPDLTAQQVISLSQKNWRLNGLLRGDLEVDGGDILVCQVLGNEGPPTDRRPAGVAMAIFRPGEQGHEWLDERCPPHGFANISDDELLDVSAEWDDANPAARLIDFLTRGLVELGRDVVNEGDIDALPRLGLRTIERTGTTREAVERLNRLLSAIGLGGETLVDATLEAMLQSCEIASYEWVSLMNATAPVDFRASSNGVSLAIEVKTTKRRHGVPFMISVAELHAARQAAAYEIWRVSEFRLEGDAIMGSLRRGDPKPLVDTTLNWLNTTPEGVRVPGVELRPAAFEWNEALPATCPVSRVPDENWSTEIDLAS